MENLIESLKKSLIDEGAIVPLISLIVVLLVFWWAIKQRKKMDDDKPVD